MVEYDYDLCETCEAKNVHFHPMVRINMQMPMKQIIDHSQSFSNNLGKLITEKGDMDLEKKTSQPQIPKTEDINKFERQKQNFENYIKTPEQPKLRLMKKPTAY